MDDLKGRYGDRMLLSPADLVEVLGISEGQQANLRSSGKFPIATKKIGSSVRVSIYDLAKYLSAGAETAAKAEIKGVDTVNRIAKKQAKGRLAHGWWLSYQTKVFAVLERVRLEARLGTVEKELEHGRF